jgi:thioredoxin-dependent peroxiredoxin
VLGVSADTAEDLAHFRDKYKLNFPLAGDGSHKTLEAYGVWQEKNLYGVKKMGIVRTTYILNADGLVEHVFPKVKVDGHIREVLEALKS